MHIANACGPILNQSSHFTASDAIFVKREKKYEASHLRENKINLEMLMGALLRCTASSGHLLALLL